MVFRQTKKGNTIALLAALMAVMIMLSGCSGTATQEPVQETEEDVAVQDNAANEMADEAQAEEDSMADEAANEMADEAQAEEDAMADEAQAEEGSMADAQASDADVTFVMTGQNFKFVMDGNDNPEMRVKRGQKVRVEFSSTDGFHDWVLDEFEAATERVRPEDGMTVVEFVAGEEGTYEYYCSVGSHRASGMKGVFVVEAAEATE